MEVLNYLLALVASFSGIFVGMFLGYIAKEELKPGKQYFLWMQNIILILSGIFVLYSFHFNVVLFVITGLVITLGIINFSPDGIMGYVFLAILVFLSIGNTNLFILTSSMVFLYGLPAGSLFLIRKK
jgi:hypothetical protein